MLEPIIEAQHDMIENCFYVAGETLLHVLIVFICSQEQQLKGINQSLATFGGRMDENEVHLRRSKANIEDQIAWANRQADEIQRDK